ncbi:V-type ATP synthase subunit E [Novisyntrophococcus fermenticellae]|uniref:V-type ATP synthase subunit E n=1 Tax=Novisyntrophococcus fermenticellae TaxID=2068655 RepID=UPI001E636E00|nr:V-type ATP synthase subunit E [Novisyntrophococcus fermenticellae]
MSGLDKMTQQILSEAQKEAEGLLADAKREEEEILAQGRNECEAWDKESSDLLDKELNEFRARAASAREQKRRRAILEAKQEIIAEMLEKVHKRMYEADSDEYFGFLRQMFGKYCHKGEGRMFLSARDLKRVPQGFLDSVEKIAGEKGGSVRLSKEPGQIADGFLLIYGDIEENCTFEALLQANKGRLIDQANRMLWRECDG